jgi:prepilin-type N-terminal cleavage/methylation domain-containing protein
MMHADEQRRRGHATREAGFTLIEVIVALALFALAATVLASAYVNVLDATERVKSDQAFEQDIALVRE